MKKLRCEAKQKDKNWEEDQLEAKKEYEILKKNLSLKVEQEKEELKEKIALNKAKIARRMKKMDSLTEKQCKIKKKLREIGVKEGKFKESLTEETCLMLNS